MYTKDSKPHGTGGYRRGCRCEVCRAAAVAAAIAYAKAHPDQKRESDRRYLDAHPEEKRARDKARREANIEEARAKERAWKRDHPEQVKARMKTWSSANRERLRELGRRGSAKYRQEHPEAVRALAHARRVRICGVGSEDFTLEDVISRDGWACGVCGGPVDPSAKGRSSAAPSLDHIIPISRGGPHTLANAQLAHFGCNAGKGAKLDLRQHPSGDIVAGTKAQGHIDS